MEDRDLCHRDIFRFDYSMEWNRRKRIKMMFIVLVAMFVEEDRIRSIEETQMNRSSAIISMSDVEKASKFFFDHVSLKTSVESHSMKTLEIFSGSGNWFPLQWIFPVPEIDETSVIFSFFSVMKRKKNKTTSFFLSFFISRRVLSTRCHQHQPVENLVLSFFLVQVGKWEILIDWRSAWETRRSI